MVSQGPAAFDVNFHSLLIEVWSMVNSQIPLLTGQPSVDIELLQNNALSTQGWSVLSGGWHLRIYHALNLNQQ